MPSIRKTVATCLLFGSLTVPLTGCVLDINKTIEEIRKPTVVFEEPASWRCAQEPVKLPTTTGKLEACTVCENVGSLAQSITINGARHTAVPQGTVALCETDAYVTTPLPHTPPPPAGKR